MVTLAGRKSMLDGDEEALMKGVDVSIAETELSDNRKALCGVWRIDGGMVNVWQVWS